MSDFYGILVMPLKGTWGHPVRPPAWSRTVFHPIILHTCALLLSVGFAVFLGVVPEGLVKLHVMERHFL